MTAPAILTSGDVGRQLLRLSIPMTWALVAMMGFNLVDTWFVAQLGTGPLAAMGFCFPVIMGLVNVGIGLMAGTSSVLARVIGEGNKAKVQALATDTLWLALLVSVVVGGLGLLTIDPLFRAMGAPPELLPLIRDYMWIWFLGFPFILVPMAAMGALRATGDTRTQAKIMVFASVINLVLDPLLIFGLFGFPRLELAGAALATILARVLTLGMGYRAMHHTHDLLLFQWRPRRELIQSWREILHIALPAASTNMIIPLGSGFIVALLAGFGAATVAGYSAAMRIEGMSLVVFYALSSVIGPFVGQNLGAGKLHRVAKGVQISGLACMGLGFALTAVMLALAPELSALFSDDATVVEISAAYLRIGSWGFGAAGVVMVVAAAFNGIGYPRPAVVISAGRVFVLYVPLAWAGASLFGATGVFFATVTANLAAGILGYLWFSKRTARLVAEASASEAAPSSPPRSSINPLNRNQ